MPNLQIFDPAPLGGDTPDSVIAWAREVLRSAPDTAPSSVYDALRAAVWKLLTARAFGDELSSWHDALRQISSLLLALGSPMGERVRALGELILESVRFGEVHSVELAMSREHVVEILRAIQRDGGESKRSEIVKITGLGQANLSRILNSLTSIGLVERRARGREVLVSLTDLARQSLMRPSSGAPGLEVTPAFNNQANSRAA